MARVLTALVGTLALGTLASPADAQAPICVEMTGLEMGDMSLDEPLSLPADASARLAEAGLGAGGVALAPEDTPRAPRLWCYDASDPRCYPVGEGSSATFEWLPGPLKFGRPENTDVAASAATEVKLPFDRDLGPSSGVRRRVDRPPRANRAPIPSA